MNADMRTLLAGIALILLLGIAGFVYRNALEKRDPLPEGACTLDAKICPDGTAVGRTGPSCAFAACPFPNVEFPDAGIAFVVPEGYALSSSLSRTDPTLVAAYERTGTSSPRHAILVRRFAIPEGQTADQIVLENTLLEPSGMGPNSMSAFSPRIIGSRTFLAIIVERFEALVRSIYYLPRANDVLAFEVVERDVAAWTEPGLIVDNLPQHQTLLRMLASLDLVSE